MPHLPLRPLSTPAALLLPAAAHPCRTAAGTHLAGSSTPAIDPRSRAGHAADTAELLYAAAQPLGRAQGGLVVQGAVVGAAVRDGAAAQPLARTEGGWG